MSCDPQVPPPPLVPYTQAQSVYRAVIYKDWLKNNNTRVHHKLFVRFNKDKGGSIRQSNPRALSSWPYRRGVRNRGTERCSHSHYQKEFDA